MFQERPLLNRAVLDTAGYAGPSVVLTRNPLERREQMLDRALVIGSAFFLAPLHAWLFLKLFGRRLPSELLMRIPYKQLLDLHSFREGLHSLSRTILEDSRGRKHWQAPAQLLKDDAFADRIRKQVIRAKSHMLLWDLLAESMIFTNIRFLTNWFTQKHTGKNQFTGEYGVVDQHKLDQLHAEQARKRKFSERAKQIFNSALAIVAPVGIALGLRSAFLNPHNMGFLARGLRKVASGFDYNRGLYLGLGSLGVMAGLQYLGYLMAARDKYELREKATVQGIGNYIFFFGNWTWMQLLGRLFGKERLPALRSVGKSVSHLAQKGAAKPQIRQAATRAAWLYWLCFALNNLSFASLVVVNNKMTTNRVRNDAAKLNPALLAGALPQWPKRYRPRWLTVDGR